MGRSAFGSNTALPIWVEFMKTALKDMPNTPLKQPDGLVSVRIDPKTENIPKEMQQAPGLSDEDQTSSSTDEEDIPEQLF